MFIKEYEIYVDLVDVINVDVIVVKYLKWKYIDYG